MFLFLVLVVFVFSALTAPVRTHLGVDCYLTCNYLFQENPLHAALNVVLTHIPVTAKRIKNDLYNKYVLNRPV